MVWLDTLPDTSPFMGLIASIDFWAVYIYLICSQNVVHNLVT